MSLYTFNPLRDSRWPALVARHPRASVFHTAGWIEALRQSYGYEPIGFTTAPPGRDIDNAVVFSNIKSWLTGKRLVSLPFSDHCEPLVEDGDAFGALSAGVSAERLRNGWRYIEFRPRHPMTADPARLEESDRFWFHEIDLRPESDVLFRAFHKDSIQRKIRRAEREDIRCEEGRTAELLAQFYRLLVVTRRRHGLPPQPFQWFCCLADCLGGSFSVRVARQRGRPIAAMITLRHRDVTVYKYGASDATAHSTGAVPLLFWKAIQDARAAGCTAFDLGRTDFDNGGLATFKDRLGAARTSLSYWRSFTGAPKKRSSHGWVASRVGEAFSHLPDGLRITAGELLYKHVG